MNWAELKRRLGELRHAVATEKTPLAKLEALMRWIDRQPNIVSAVGHGLLCLFWMTLGLLIAWVQLLATGDREMASRILIFFAGMCVGGYSLRETDDARKAIGMPDEGTKLGHGFVDLYVPIAATVGIGVYYASLF